MIRWYVTPCITITRVDGSIINAPTIAALELKQGEQVIGGTVIPLTYAVNKYKGLWSACYTETEPPYSAALVRCPDKVTPKGVIPPIEMVSSDIIRELVTPEDWVWLHDTYPTLDSQFADQPNLAS